MKRCFGYVRVSTAKQGLGVSLTAQKEAIGAFADRNGIEIAEWFEERETAAKSGRPIFDGMIEALLRGKAGGVVIHKIDRSARNIGDWARIGELADAGIDVHFATETLDFRSRSGRLSADIQAVIAADYIRNLREETIKGISGRLKQGLYPFRAPIGYLDNGGGKPKTVDPVRGPLIRQMFELYASGQYSFRKLRTEMERRGLRNPNGKPISRRGIETVLGNPFYCGIIRIHVRGETFPGVHEPLVRVGLFDTVQAVRFGRSHKKVTRRNHTYRGLFRCAWCDAAMTPELQKGHVYYRCQRRSCPTKCVREEEIERAVLSVLSRVQLSDNDVTRLVTDAEAWLEARKGQDHAAPCRLQLSQVETRLDRLTDAVVDGLIDRETYLNRREALLFERARLQEELAGYERGDDARNVRNFLELIKSYAETYISAIASEKREIVEVTTSNRIVRGKTVELEPSDWLQSAELALAGPYGAPYRPTSRKGHELLVSEKASSGAPSRPTSRRGQHLSNEHIEHLIALANARSA